jgi:beta-mannosidase
MRARGTRWRILLGAALAAGLGGWPSAEGQVPADAPGHAGQGQHAGHAHAAPPGAAGAYRMLHHWRFRPADADADWGSAEIPGNLHADLLREGIIPHPWAGTNEDSLQWVHERDWAYAHTLTLTEADLAHDRIELVFEGLDTYADVYVNGAHALRANNAFRAWTIPAAGLLEPGDNTIEVVFRAPGPEEERLARASRVDDWPGGLRALSRKPAHHDGWDWAPRYRTMGISHNAYFRAWSGARLADAHLRLDSLRGAGRTVRPAEGWEGGTFVPDTAWLTLEVAIEAAADAELGLHLGGELPPAAWTVRVADGLTRIRHTVVLPAPRLWWTWDLLPEGDAEPALYRAAVWIGPSAEGPAPQPDPATALDTRRWPLGLRVAELVSPWRPEPLAARSGETPGDTAAAPFYLRLNGRPVYARGANWVPTSTFAFGYVPDYLRLLADVRATGLNLLRVWGGGRYEYDVFYDACDRAGILVWQDAMFACAMVPGPATGLPEWADNVDAELEEQIRRLRRHPSVALWCGNNESAEGWLRWGWRNDRSNKERERLEADYDRLFHERLPDLLGRLDPAMAYWPSSPGYGRADPASYRRGDAHDWWVWHDGWPFRHYEDALPRFMSEFGFQAYPDPRTIAAWRGGLPALMDSADAFLAAHQKHPRGAAVIDGFLRRWFGETLPDSLLPYVYLSQWLQAEGMGRAVEAQRARRPWTMGSVYWQLNDVWPAVSWSGIDVDGRWKALQHRLARSMAPVALALDWDSAGAALTLLHDADASAGLVWQVELWTAAGQRLYDAAGFVEARPEARVPLWSASAEALADLSCDDVLLHAELRELGRVTASVTRLPGLPVDWPMAESGITWRAETNADGWPRVRLRAEHPALGVWLHTPYEGRFSDNGFDLLPGREIVVDLEPPFGRKPGWNVEIPDPERFRASLRVLTLGDVLSAARAAAAERAPLPERD